MKAKLYCLPITSDLKLTFARVLEDRIRHYKVPFTATIAGLDPQELVSNFIKEAEGIESEFYILKPKNEETKNVTYQVASRKVQKVLKKVKVYHLIHQRQIYLSLFDKYSDWGWHLYKKYVYPLYLKLTGKTAPWTDVRYLPGFSHRGYREVDLAYKYEVSDEKLAFEKLGKDLETLSEKNLILGTYTVPTTSNIADTWGTGLTYKVVYCSVSIDTKKLAKLAGKDPFIDTSLKLNDIGVNEVGVAGPWVGLDPIQKYNIEEVEVQVLVNEGNRKVIYDAFLNGVKTANKVAKKHKEFLDSHEKISNSNTLIGYREDRGILIPDCTKVNVDVTFRKKTD